MTNEKTLRCCCTHCGHDFIINCPIETGMERCYLADYGEGEAGCTTELIWAKMPKIGFYMKCHTDFCNENPWNKTGLYGNGTYCDSIFDQETHHTSSRSDDGVNIGVGVVVGVFVLAIILIWLIKRYCCDRRRGVVSPPEMTLNSIYGGSSSAITRVLKSEDGNKPLHEIMMVQKIELKEKIGEGSYGRVHRGVYQDGNVAVKIFKRHRDFEREVDIYKLIQEKNDYILGKRGDGTRPNSVNQMEIELWLVTDFCELGSLQGFLDQKEIVNVDVCIRMCSDIVHGLVYLHETENMLTGRKPAIAHRDLKPSNIFLRAVPNGVRCIIGDFGFAIACREFIIEKRVVDVEKGIQSEVSPNDEELTAHAVAGTFRYMAPEILCGKIDRMNFECFRHSDIYSLALIMWEIGASTKVEGRPSIGHQLPYEEYRFGPGPRAAPNDKEMIKILIIRKKRPSPCQHWGDSKVMANFYKMLSESWNEPSRRLTATLINKKLNAMTTQSKKENYFNLWASSSAFTY